MRRFSRAPGARFIVRERALPASSAGRSTRALGRRNDETTKPEAGRIGAGG
jgi:hypothetical protein